MTLFDFLAQAGFWQWVGILCLASITVQGILGLACILAKKAPK